MGNLASSCALRNSSDEFSVGLSPVAYTGRSVDVLVKPKRASRLLIHKAKPIHTGYDEIEQGASLAHTRSRDNAEKLLSAAQLYHSVDATLLPPSMGHCQCSPIPDTDPEFVLRRAVATGRVSANFTGLQSCGSGLCPTCGKKKGLQHAQEVNRFTVAHWGGELAAPDSGGIYLLTWSIRHTVRHKLVDLFWVLDQALKKMRHGRSAPLRVDHPVWQRAGVSLTGFVLGLEETHGDSGWHPHVHLLLFTDRPIGDSVSFGSDGKPLGRQLGQQLRDLDWWRARTSFRYAKTGIAEPKDVTPLGRAACPGWVKELGIDPTIAPQKGLMQLLSQDVALCWAWELSQAWISAVESVAGDLKVVPTMSGLDVATVVDLRGIDGYLAKVGVEVAGVSKKGRGNSRTIHQLLACAVGLDGATKSERAKARALVLEWRGASHRRRRFRRSAGSLSLAALYPEEEHHVPDLVLGAGEVEEIGRGRVPASLFSPLRRCRRWHPDQLELVRAGEAATLRLWQAAGEIQDHAVEMGKEMPSAKQALSQAVDELSAARVFDLESEAPELRWSEADRRARYEVDPRRWGLRPLSGDLLMKWCGERQGPGLPLAWLEWMQEVHRRCGLDKPWRWRWARAAARVCADGLERSSMPPAATWSSIQVQF